MPIDLVLSVILADVADHIRLIDPVQRPVPGEMPRSAIGAKPLEVPNETAASNGREVTLRQSISPRDAFQITFEQTVWLFSIRLPYLHSDLSIGC